MNISLVQYLFSPQSIDSTYFPDLTLSETNLTRIAGFAELVLLPSTALLQAIIWLASKQYAFKASPTRLIHWTGVAAYLLNLLLIPYAILNLIGIPIISSYLPTWQYGITLILTIIVVSFLNSYRRNNLSLSTEALLLRIDKRIEEIISQEKKTSRQRIRTEALLTIKDVFSKLRFASVNFSYAMISAMFIAIKEDAAAKNPRQTRFEALEAETSQASKFLARSLA